MQVTYLSWTSIHLLVILLSLLKMEINVRLRRLFSLILLDTQIMPEYKNFLISSISSYLDINRPDSTTLTWLEQTFYLHTYYIKSFMKKYCIYSTLSKIMSYLQLQILNGWFIVSAEEQKFSHYFLTYQTSKFTTVVSHALVQTRLRMR